MKILKFLGPTHILSIDNQRIMRGEEATVSDATAARLKKSGQVDVEVRNVSSPPSTQGAPQSSTSIRSGNDERKTSTSRAPATAAAKDEEKEK